MAKLKVPWLVWVNRAIFVVALAAFFALRDRVGIVIAVWVGIAWMHYENSWHWEAIANGWRRVAYRAMGKDESNGR